MKTIKEILAEKVGIAPKKRAPNSELAEVIEALMVFMGEPAKPAVAAGASKTPYGRRFGYWLGKTRRLTPAQIYQLMRRAQDGKNPASLFNFLLKAELAKLPAKPKTV